MSHKHQAGEQLQWDCSNRPSKHQQNLNVRETYFAGLDRKRSKSFGLIGCWTDMDALHRWLYSQSVDRFARLVDVLKVVVRTKGRV